MQMTQNRRDFLAGASLAAAAGVLGARGSLADEGPPEVSTIRLPFNSNLCVAPQYVAEELLRAEGFTEIRYVPSSGGLTEPQMAGSGEIDFGITTAAVLPFRLDGGAAVTALAGVHSGCYELFAHNPIRTIGDLKGKRVGIQRLNSGGHLYLSIMAAHVGLDPHQDIEWIVPPEGNAKELFAEGKVDAFLGFPPEPQELRARGVGRVILNTATDQPWSQYLCCLAFGNREFVRNYPIATKRVVRAILKAADVCASDPERARPTSGRWRVHRALRLRAPDADRAAVRPLARVRPGGRDAVLRASIARGGHDHVEPEHDSRRGHRLALPERAQARAEGMTGPAGLSPN